MSTLQDITARANNNSHSKRPPASQRWSVVAASETPDTHYNFVDTDPVKPHFMTSTSASRTRVSTPPALSRPSTPVPINSNASNSSGWMASASKRLRIPAAKSRKQAKVSTKKISPTTTSSHDPVKRAPAQLSPADTSQPLPPHPGVTREKPLPSLPIATVVTKSPVNRISLIDATEKPLRRSVSPSPGSPEIEEWPSLSPSRPRSPKQTLEKAVTPITDVSLPTSPIEADENKENVTPQTLSSSTRGTSPPMPSSSDQEQTDTSLLRLDSPYPHTITLSPWSEKSFQKLGSGGRTTNTVRQTKTSLMRTRLSPEDSAMGERETLATPRPQSLFSQISPEPSITEEPQRLSGGPIRSKSRSRHLATRQGSPYTTIRQAQAKMIESRKRMENRRILMEMKMEGSSRCASATSHRSCNSAEVIAVKQARSVENADRRSSIPLPRRLIRNTPDYDSEGEFLIVKPDKKQKTKVEAKRQESDDGDVDTDFLNDANRTDSLDTSMLSPRPVAAGAIQDSPDLPPAPDLTTTETKRTISDISTNITLDFADLNLSSDEDTESDVGSHHSFGDFDPAGYRVRRLSGVGPKIGPLLRVSDDADEVIFGPPRKRNITHLNGDDSLRASAPDLRRSLLLREAASVLRKSKEGVKAHLPRPLSKQSLQKSDGQVDGQGNGQGGPHDNSTPPGLISKNDVLIDGNIDDKKVLSSPAESEQLLFDHPDDVPVTSPQLNSAATFQPEDRNPAFKEDNWPLTTALPTTIPTAVVLPTVHELSAEENLWIPPLPKKDFAPSPQGDEPKAIVSPEVPGAPPNSPVSNFPKPSNHQSAFVSNKGLSMTERRSSAYGLSHNNIIAVPASIIVHPPRSSSKHQVRTWKTGSTKTTSRSTGIRSPAHTAMIPNRFESPESSPQTNGTTTVEREASTRSPGIFSTLENSNSVVATGNFELVSGTAKVATPVSAKSGVLSNFRGLFHKRSGEPGALSDIRTTPGSQQRKAKDSKPNHQFTPVNSATSENEATQTMRSHRGRRTPASNAKGLSVDCPGVTAKYCSPTIEPNEIQNARDLAFEVLDLAKNEPGKAKKGVLLDVGKIMVQAVNECHNAHKAVEEARQAAARAEIAALNMRQKVMEVVDVVQGFVNSNNWV